jgi:hypothetical protein
MCVLQIRRREMQIALLPLPKAAALQIVVGWQRLFYCNQIIGEALGI